LKRKKSALCTRLRKHTDDDNKGKKRYGENENTFKALYARKRKSWDGVERGDGVKAAAELR
jgi:hypothetical protein